MPKAVSTRIEYLGAFNVIANTTYSTTDITTNYPDATLFIMNTKGVLEGSKYRKVKVSIVNGTTKSPKFEIEYGQVTAFDSTRTPALKYTFDQDCTVVIGKELGAI